MNLKQLKKNRFVFWLVIQFRCWIEKHSYIKGSQNKVSNRGVKVRTKVQIVGECNSLDIEKGAVLKNTLIKIQGNNNIVKIGAGCLISGAELWIEDNNCELVIGERTFVGHHTHIAVTEDESKVKIGSDCLVSSYVQVRTGDSHSIIDNAGARINKAQSVIISDHCWLGEGCRILKGVFLSENTVVATGAIVTNSNKNNVLLAGVPSKVVKENINWKSERI